MIKVHRKVVYKDVIFYKLSNKVERWHKYTQKLDPILPWLQ